jgi:hypothetical protein
VPKVVQGSGKPPNYIGLWHVMAAARYSRSYARQASRWRVQEDEEDLRTVSDIASTADDILQRQARKSRFQDYRFPQAQSVDEFGREQSAGGDASQRWVWWAEFFCKRVGAEEIESGRL